MKQFNGSKTQCDMCGKQLASESFMVPISSKGILLDEICLECYISGKWK